MPSFKEIKRSEFTVIQLFDLALDVNSYPLFLPWCKEAKILSSQNNLMIAELKISFPPFEEKYTSKIEYCAPQSNDQVARINTSLVEGPFEYLFNNWEFIPTENGSVIDFSVDFQFKSTILDRLVSLMFGKATKKITQAFERRAREIY